MLTEIFGNHPQVKVIEFLLSNPHSEYREEELLECAGIGGDSLPEFFNKLKDQGLIKPTRMVEDTQFYGADMESPTMQALKAFQAKLKQIDVEKEVDNEEGGAGSEESHEISSANDQPLSKSKKNRIIAEHLTANELTRKEILSVVESYYSDEDDLYNIFKNTLTFAFASDEPFKTASTYLNNVSRFYPHFKKSIFYGSNASMFKNMIMEKKGSHIKVKNREEYRRAQEEFSRELDLKPPKSVNVLNTIMDDKNSIQKIMYDPDYYLRIKNIFPSYVSELQRLKIIVLRSFEEEIEGLEAKKQPEVMGEVIENANRIIKELEAKKEILEKS
jgi:hypothetical protein